MSSRFEGLSPIVVAASKSPQGTTLEELRAKFAKPEDRLTPFVAEVRARLSDARYEWSRVNGKWSIPDGVADRLRGDVLWEMERDGGKR